MATFALQTFEDILMDSQPTFEEEYLVSDTSYQEAIQVWQVWHQEEEEDNDTNRRTAAPMEDDDDVIMQLEADEGLLPSLNDFYDSISGLEIDFRPPKELLDEAAAKHDSFLVNDTSIEKEKTRIFEETLKKLTESMRRSRETRGSLYAKTPELRDYNRVGSVEKVLRSIDFSSRQIDSYCKTVRANAL